MKHLFNTSFEASLHVLILLGLYEAPVSVDMITYMDFITVYSKSFDIGNENLNGENNYKYGELSSKRRMIKSALKRLVLDGMVKAEITADGLQYSITEFGRQYEETLDSDYAVRYRNEASIVITEMLGMNEQEINTLLKDKSLKERKGEF